MSTVRLDLLVFKSNTSPSDCSRRIQKRLKTLHGTLPTTMLEHTVTLLLDEYDKHLKFGLDPGLETFLSPLPAVARFVHTMFRQIEMHGEIFPCGKGSIIEMRGGNGARKIIFEELVMLKTNGGEVKGRIDSAFAFTEQTITTLLKHAIESCLIPYVMRRDFSKTRVANHMGWSKVFLLDHEWHLAGNIFRSVNYNVH